MPIAQRTQVIQAKAIGRLLPVAFVFFGFAFFHLRPPYAEAANLRRFCAVRLAEWKHPRQWATFTALTTPQERSHFIRQLRPVELEVFLERCVKRAWVFLETERFKEASQELDAAFSIIQGEVDRRDLFELLELLLYCAQNFDIPIDLKKKSVSLMGSIASDVRFYPTTSDASLPTPALLILRILNTTEISDQVEVPLQMEMVATLRLVALASETPVRLRLARRLSEIAEDRRRPRPLRSLAETCAQEMSTLH